MKKFFFVLFILPIFLYSQLESAHWYFGNHAGLDFTSGSPVAVTDGVLNTLEGCASISNKQGNLLFYTDGGSVYNRNHKIMLNGTGLLGHYSSTQSAIIVPDPYNKDIYYIFTVDDATRIESKGIHYSMVDMSLDSGLGAVVIDKKNIPLPLGGVQSSSEKIAAVKHANRKDVWVVTHYKDTYYAFLVNQTGVITTPVPSKVGPYVPTFEESTDFLSQMYSIGYLKISSNGKKIAAAHHLHSLVLGDFNTSTGKVSNHITLEIDPGNPETYYGVEFSPNSKILYVSSVTGLLQYDLTAPSIKNSKFKLYPDFKTTIDALQLGLDGKIYIATAKSYLSVINNPNVYGAGADFKDMSISLNGKLSTYGLPPFISSFFEENILVNNDPEKSEACINEILNFSLNTEIISYTVKWDFGDGNTSTELTPIHSYPNSGEYVVKATIKYENEILESTKTITVNPPLNIDLGPDQTICPGSSTMLEVLGNHPTGTIYLWSTKETTPSITVNQAGIYDVLVTYPSGCTGTKKVQVNIAPEITIDLGPDQTICPGSSTMLEVLGNHPTGTTYLWSTKETTPSITVNQAGIYEVLVAYPSGCTGTKKVQVNIAPEITIDLGPDQTICPGSSTMLEVLGNHPTGTTYLWSTKETTPSITVNQAGIYEVLVTYPSGCTGTKKVQVNIAEITIDLGPDQTICPGSSTILKVLGNHPTGTTYLWSTKETTPSITVNQAGIYEVLVTYPSGCTGTKKVQVNIAPEITIDLGPDQTICPGSSTIVKVLGNHPTGTTFLWSTKETTPSITVNQAGIYEVLVTYPSGCTGTKKVQVHMESLPTIIAKDVETCESSAQITVDITHSSTYSVSWKTPSGKLISNQETIDADESGVYTVTVTTKEGCSMTKEVKVSLNHPPLIQKIEVSDHTATIFAQGNLSLEYSLNQVDWQSSSVFDNLNGRVYTVYVRDIYGCISSKKFVVFSIPNIITPNGDGINDTWNIPGIENYPKSKVKIFNRYGKVLVDKQVNSNPVWDGKYSDRAIPTDNYWYIIELSDGNKLSGWVVVKNHSKNTK